MSHRVHQIAASLALALAAVAQAVAQTPISPVRPNLPSAGGGLPQLKICYTQVYTSSSTSRLFARPCTNVEAPGTVFIK